MSNSRIECVVRQVGGNRRSKFVGQPRWVDPATGTAYDRPEGGERMNDGFFRDGDSYRTHGATVYHIVNPTTGRKAGVGCDTQAFKADDGKPNWFLLMSGQGCAKALAGVVRVLSFAVRSKDKGGKGYAEHSWRQVPNAKERYQAALYRHLNKLELGETHDDESGESHWYHVATNALFLAELHNAEEKQ